LNSEFEACSVEGAWILFALVSLLSARYNRERSVLLATGISLGHPEPDSPLQLESTLGHYEIQSRLGAGGMGEVFLARDTRLDRLVALKVLPEAFAADEQRLRRFLQEAKVTSALKHPNIGHLYEIGEAGGIYYLAIEYVEGPTLRALIGNKPLATDQLIYLAIQVADALEEAHEAGVLHRDIKPENLMLDKRGRLKVLDFGLARMEAKAATQSIGETRTQALTDPGVVMGTPLYMSPEQALGQSMDTRSDLFSLGVVMYQMATSALPFQGKTSPEITDAILHQPVTAPVRINPRIPAELEPIVLRLLEREPALRYQTASDLVADLRRLKRDSESGQQVPAISRKAPARKPRPERSREAAPLPGFGHAADYGVDGGSPSSSSRRPAASASLPRGVTCSGCRPIRATRT
jgi:serine/threonine protein kinase